MHLEKLRIIKILYTIFIGVKYYIFYYKKKLYNGNNFINGSSVK